MKPYGKICKQHAKKELKHIAHIAGWSKRLIKKWRCEFSDRIKNGCCIFLRTGDGKYYFGVGQPVLEVPSECPYMTEQVVSQEKT